MATLAEINTAIRTAAANVGVSVYMGHIYDYAVVDNPIGFTDPVLVVEPPTGSGNMIRTNALQTDYQLKLYMLTSDTVDSGADITENGPTSTARQILFEQMDSKMTEFVWSFTNLIKGINTLRLIAPSSIQAVDQYTDKMQAGVIRVLGLRNVVANPQCQTV
jgi:hypothetical protein